MKLEGFSGIFMGPKRMKCEGRHGSFILLFSFMIDLNRLIPFKIMIVNVQVRRKCCEVRRQLSRKSDISNPISSAKRVVNF